LTRAKSIRGQFGVGRAMGVVNPFSLPAYGFFANIQTREQAYK